MAEELQQVAFPPSAQGGTEDEVAQADAAELDAHHAQRRSDIESIYQKRLTDEPPLLKAALAAKLMQWPNWLETIKKGPSEVTGMHCSGLVLLLHYMICHRLRTSSCYKISEVKLNTGIHGM